MMTYKSYLSQYYTKQIAAILTMTRLLSSTSQLKEQIILLVREINKMLRAENTLFYVLKEEKQEIWSRFVLNGELKQLQMPLTKGVAEYVLRNRKIINVHDMDSMPKLKMEVRKVGDTPIRNFLFVPITNKENRVIGGIQVINKHQGHFNHDDIRYLMITSNLIPFMIQKNEQQGDIHLAKKLEKDLERAARIQRQLLPKREPQIPGYDIFAYNEPSESIGGDYFDFFPFSRSLSLVVSDVSGKGISAALLTANLHAFLHAFINERDSGREIVQKLNNHLYLYTEPEMYATFFWGNLNFEEHKFKFVNAGHLPPIVLKKDGSVKALKAGGVPVGILDSYAHKEAEVHLEQGDIMVIFSDGISDTMNNNEELFGRKRIIDTVRRNAHLSSEKIGNMILKEMNGFTDSTKYCDDKTIVILKREALS